jgi:hypothetical protein
LHVLSVFHFLVILLFELFPKSLVVLLHFLFFKLFPLKLDLLLELLLPLLGLLLLLLLGDDIAHEHLTVEGLHHIGVIVELLVRFDQLRLSQ